MNQTQFGKLWSYPVDGQVYTQPLIVQGVTIGGVSRNLVIVGAVVLVGLAVLYRPLLFSSVDPEIAAARGVPLRALSVAIFLLLALTTAEAIQVVGVLLVLTLVITPAAAAQRLTGRPERKG